MHRAQLVAIFVALALVGGAYTIYQTKGSTTVGVTITTNPDLERGLVGHWTFDGSYVDWSNTSAEIRDRSSQARHGNAIGSLAANVSVVPGPIGQSLKFDGSTDYANLGWWGPGSTMSFAAWIEPQNTNHSEVILGNRCNGITQNGIGIYINSWSTGDGKLIVETGNGTAGTGTLTDAGAITFGTWSHIAVTVDKNAARANIYINGGFATSGPVMSDFRDGWEWFMGYFACAAIKYKGKMDDVRVYSRELSDSEVQRLYQLGNTTRVAETIDTNPDLNRGLVGHWTFDGADVDWGSTTAEIKDRSGNNNHGNASSTMSTYKSATPGVLGQALKFSTTTSDFVSDYVEVADSDSISFTAGGGVDKPFSVGGWVYMNYTGSPTYSPAFVAKTFGGNNEWSLESQMGGVYTIRTFDGPSPDWIGRTYSGVNLVQAYRNQWVHLFATYDGSMNAAGFRLYLNGLRVDNSNDINTTYDGIPQSAAAVRLGNGFAGKLDDVRIYNRALSAEEVKRLYELGEGTRVNMTLSSPTLDSGLVGHWTFDGADVDWGSTTAEIKDTSGQGNHGNAQGSMSAQLSPTPGMMGQGMKYNGTTDYVTAPASTANFGSGAFSAFMWLRSNEDTNEAALLGNNQYGVPGGWLLFRPAGGTIRINLDAGFTQYLTGTTNVFNDQWHFVGVSRTAGGRYDLWVDGVSQANTNAAVYDVNTSNSLHFMTQFDQASRSVRGTIDDVRVYNRVLSADEVKRLYDMGR